MNKITLQIIKNNLPISDVCRTVAIDKVDKNGKVTTCEMDNPVYKWYNKDTKKWYFGDRWSQQCNLKCSRVKARIRKLRPRSAKRWLRIQGRVISI